MKYFIGVTRFNYETWREQCNYTNNNDILLYNTSNKITENVPFDSYLFVLEMHNDENKIKGIGLIQNSVLHLKERTKIYTHQNYNRYSYKLISRISRENLAEFDENIIKFFDIMCFGGSTHLKRGKGIQKIPDNIEKNCKHIICFSEYFKNLFKKYNSLNI